MSLRHSKLPKRVGGTCWMAHIQRVLDALFSSYPAFMGLLENASHKVPKVDVMMYAVMLHIPVSVLLLILKCINNKQFNFLDVSMRL